MPLLSFVLMCFVRVPSPSELDGSTRLYDLCRRHSRSLFADLLQSFRKALKDWKYGLRPTVQAAAPQ